MSHDLARYHRQMLLPGFGEEGQQRLRESTVIVLGCGALGCVVADLLARAGVGHLVIADRDFIELTNLQRQVLFDEFDVSDAIPKAEAAKRRIARINSQVQVTAIVDDINHTNIERYSAGADVLVDGLDNLETRYLANDLAVKNGIPYVYGAAVGATGMTFAIMPRSDDGGAAWERRNGGSLATLCLRCLFDEPLAPGTLPTCDTVGVLGSAVGTVANFQVTETLKILTGNFDAVSRTLLNVDVWANQVMQLKINPDSDCPCCVHKRFEFLEGKSGASADSLCGRDAVQLRPRQQADAIDMAALAKRLQAQGDVTTNEFMLRARITDSEEDYEITLFPDGRAIVKGTGDVSVARSIVAKYIGT